MPSRTNLLFRALSSPERLRVLRAILGEEAIGQAELRKRLSLGQPTLSRHLRDLSAEGLIERLGNTRAPFRASRPVETRAMLRAAGLIHAGHHGESASDGMTLVREMARQEEDAGDGT